MTSSVLEEHLREAACLGDLDTVQELIHQNVDVNCRHAINGWTPLHWAAKRGHEDVVRLLLANGADSCVMTPKGETPANVTSNLVISRLLGGKEMSSLDTKDLAAKFIPNYIRNPPLNGHVDIAQRHSRHTDLSLMPTTTLPAQSDDLVVKVRIAGSHDPDFIEVEIPRWKLTYTDLLQICCQELGIKESQVDRIRKLPNTRMRKDSDVKRLLYLQALEIVMHSQSQNELRLNGYQSISTYKDQTILY